MSLDIHSDAGFRNQFKDALNNGGVFDVEIYCISLIGIGGKLFFDVRALGRVGYAALGIAGILQIAKTVGKK